jgi:hypothetical protein
LLAGHDALNNYAPPVLVLGQWLVCKHQRVIRLPPHYAVKCINTRRHRCHWAPQRPRHRHWVLRVGAALGAVICEALLFGPTPLAIPEVLFQTTSRST